jgi:hypothetical protein
MNAVMIKDEYPDLVEGFQYKVRKIFRHGSNYHVMVEGSPRRYLVSCFEFWNNGKKIPAKEAFRLQQIEEVKRKLGMK